MPRAAAAAKSGGNGRGEVLLDPTNDSAPLIAFSEPYIARVTIEGVAPILFHRWSNEDVETKGKAAKGSKAKKTDNVEAYVYRLPNGHIAIPGEYLMGSIVGAAKYRQDPRSTRKSAMDLFKAGVVVLTELADLGTKDWDYLDRRRVKVQSNAVTRARPAFMPGWRATFDVQVGLPEYIDAGILLEVIGAAGRYVGLAEKRPSYGRFNVVRFDT